MTEFELKHGLSQDEPGPLGLEAPDDTLARTGNTADHQAGWFAGIDHARAEARESAGVGAQQLQERADKVVIANATGNPDLFQEAVKDLLAAVRMFRPAPAAGDARADRDAAFEAVRKRLCALPRYSFWNDDNGGVKRVNDRSGNWIEFDAAHGLFDAVAVDAAIAAQQGKGGAA
ncbi:hypothetical protein [Achromobacter xylosoxidans]|uniref:hypothetical protein n=1 Tax=Alcaligenes xylosoxydans xylosoxydans TaxID=85698 RepID=UPI0006C4C117|nr:hypothetical protein [Achromobacter xylosoxidans]CUI55958.1 Uncharacterised protein [Achromobacter xylosoxidans]